MYRMPNYPSAKGRASPNRTAAWGANVSGWSNANGTPRAAVGTPRVANGTPRVANGTPRVANGTPRVANGTPLVANEAHGNVNETLSCANTNGTRWIQQRIHYQEEEQRPNNVLYSANNNNNQNTSIYNLTNFVNKYTAYNSPVRREHGEDDFVNEFFGRPPSSYQSSTVVSPSLSPFSKNDCSYYRPPVSPISSAGSPTLPWAYAMPPARQQSVTCDNPFGQQTGTYGMPFAQQAGTYGMPTGKQTGTYAIQSGQQAGTYVMPTAQQTGTYAMPFGQQTGTYTMPFTQQSAQQADTYGMPTAQQASTYGMPTAQQTGTYDMPSGQQTATYDMPRTQQHFLQQQQQPTSNSLGGEKKPVFAIKQKSKIKILDPIVIDDGEDESSPVNTILSSPHLSGSEMHLANNEPLLENSIPSEKIVEDGRQSPSLDDLLNQISVIYQPETTLTHVSKTTCTVSKRVNTSGQRSPPYKRRRHSLVTSNVDPNIDTSMITPNTSTVTSNMGSTINASMVTSSENSTTTTTSSMVTSNVDSPINASMVTSNVENVMVTNIEANSSSTQVLNDVHVPIPEWGFDELDAELSNAVIDPSLIRVIRPLSEAPIRSVPEAPLSTVPEASLSPIPDALFNPESSPLPTVEPETKNEKAVKALIKKLELGMENNYPAELSTQELLLALTIGSDVLIRLLGQQ